MGAQKNMLVFIAGILMIIGGIIGIIGGIAALGLIAASGALAAAVGVAAEVGGLLALGVIASIVILITGVISLIAGVTGFKNAANPAAAPKLIKYGYITIVLAVIGIVLNIVAGGFSGTNVLSLILPIIYLLGAMQMKKESGL